jgi:hypothetical protein
MVLRKGAHTGKLTVHLLLLDGYLSVSELSCCQLGLSMRQFIVKQIHLPKKSLMKSTRVQRYEVHLVFSSRTSVSTN